MAFREAIAGRLHDEGITLGVAVVPQRDRSQKDKAFLRQYALLDLVVGHKCRMRF